MKPVLQEVTQHSHDIKYGVKQRDRAIIRARKQGLTYREIAEAANMSAAGVGKVVRKYSQATS